MKQIIIIITGLPGAGKTTIAGYFSRRNIPVIRMGMLTDLELGKRHLKFSEKNEKYIREKLRYEKGKDIYATSAFEIFKDRYSEENMVVIEGLRSREEYNFFRKVIPLFKILTVKADKKLRHKRLLVRKLRKISLNQIKDRDAQEMKRISFLEKKADCIVINSTGRKNLYKQIDSFIKE